METLGLDVGGANIKAASLKFKGKRIEGLRVCSRYFPIWKRGKEELSDAIKETVENVATSKPRAVGLTMTAELSDAYFMKRKGVKHIINCVSETFKRSHLHVLNIEGKLLTPEEAERRTLEIASANWAATGWLVSKWFRNCIVIDAGSTTTSIIPILNGETCAVGKTDLEKLMSGELVYTGSLRTNVATIVRWIPVKGRIARVSSEIFALTGDVHLLLGNIERRKYTTETANGRGKNKREAMARVARLVCADLEMLSEEEVKQICRYIYEKQINQIAEGLWQVKTRMSSMGYEPSDLTVVTLGLGKVFLARRAAERVGFRRIIDFSSILGEEPSIIGPAAALAFMTAVKIGVMDERSFKNRWKPPKGI